MKRRGALGTIGAALARTAKHFGMGVKGYTRASEDSADVDRYYHGSLAAVGAAFQHVEEVVLTRQEPLDRAIKPHRWSTFATPARFSFNSPFDCS